MSNLNLRSVTNNFQDVQLVSLASWKQANEFEPRDRGGPYAILQEGYDPQDLKMIPQEFVLGRSGKWLSLGFFYRMPVPERRAEYLFGTASEIMEMMSRLPSVVDIVRPGAKPAEPDAPGEPDELTRSFRSAKDRAVNRSGNTPTNA